MKHLLTLFLLFICITLSFTQSCEELFHNYLEVDSEILECDDYSTLEQLSNGQCILKRYDPEIQNIVYLETTKSKISKEKHGLFQKRWDNGVLISSGHYVDDKKEGEWTENVNEVGFYKNDLKEGVWVNNDNNHKIIFEANYLKGQLHGRRIQYDNSGKIELDQIFENGKLKSTTLDLTQKVEKIEPRFPGCENLHNTDKDKNDCAKKRMLEFVYFNLKYPEEARENKIDGQTIAQFTVAKNGEVTNINVLIGLCKEIKAELIKVISTMPKWIPGTENGIIVESLYTLPVKFKLEG